MYDSPAVQMYDITVYIHVNFCERSYKTACAKKVFYILTKMHVAQKGTY